MMSTHLLLVAALLLFCYLDVAHGKTLFAQAKRWAALTIVSSTAFGVVSSPFDVGSSIAYAAEADIVTTTATTTTAATTPTLNPQLSVNDLLKVDIGPKLDVLKDVQFILRLYPTYVDAGDYTSMRQGLREGPAQELRKTCKKLEKYLPVATLDSYKAQYAEMIDNMVMIRKWVVMESRISSPLCSKIIAA
jgi:hypothetical protein